MWLLLVLIPSLVFADYDCFKYSAAEYTTIVECPRGCEYSYKTGSIKQRLWGGCGDGSDICKEQNDGVTVCGCRGNKCNENGYRMSDKSVSDEADSNELFVKK